MWTYLEMILSNKLRRVFNQPADLPVKQPTQREREAAAKRSLAAARLATTERNLELGRKLAALRDTTPSNKIFGRTVCEQFDLHDPQHVAPR
jgi:hypothetical protein